MDKRKIAELLFKVSAVSLSPKNPYTFVSGTHSPIYCDNRLLLSCPEERKQIVEAYCGIISELASESTFESTSKSVLNNRTSKLNFSFDVVAGVATGSIAWAALVAEKLKKPMIYVRSEAKKHGKQNLIEGKFSLGQKVLVIEDLISTGGSAIRAIEAVHQAGGIVEHCIAIYTYEFPESLPNFAKAKCKLTTLTSISISLDVAKQSGIITHEQAETVLAFVKNPTEWSKSFGQKP